MNRYFHTISLVFAFGFGVGVFFQKVVGVGRIVSHLNRPPVHEPILPLPIPDYETCFGVLAIGQSNAANHGCCRGRAGIQIYALHEDNYYTAVDPMPGGSGSGGSVWTRLGPRLLEKPGVESVVFACVAQGSSSVESWVRQGSNFWRIESALQSFSSNNVKISVVVWHQGETESWSRHSDGYFYQEKLKEVILSLRSLGIDAPIFVCQTSRDGEGTTNEAIRLAQASVWNKADNVFAGADTDSLGERYRSDGVHFNSRGLERFAELLEEAFQRCSDQEAAKSDTQ